MVNDEKDFDNVERIYNYGEFSLDAKPRIIVDADACPVKREAAEIARAYGIEAIMVASYDHRLQPEDSVTVIQVERAYQSADMYIANLLAEHDILLTQDHGLASIGLAKKANVLSFRGYRYTLDNIDFLLDSRHTFSKLKRMKGRQGGPKPFSSADRARFCKVLTEILKALQEQGLL